MGNRRIVRLPMPKTARARLSMFRQRYMRERTHQPINDVDPVHLCDPRFVFLQTLSVRMSERIIAAAVSSWESGESA